MAGSVRVTARSTGITVERMVFKQLGGYVAGAVERALDRNFGLSANPPQLLVGTSVLVEQPTEAERTKTVEPIRLVD